MAAAMGVLIIQRMKIWEGSSASHGDILVMSVLQCHNSQDCWKVYLSFVLKGKGEMLRVPKSWSKRSGVSPSASSHSQSCNHGDAEQSGAESKS